jgi:hypothetical protein
MKPARYVCHLESEPGRAGAELGRAGGGHENIGNGWAKGREEIGGCVVCRSEVQAPQGPPRGAEGGDGDVDAVKMCVGYTENGNMSNELRRGVQTRLGAQSGVSFVPFPT